MIFSSDTQFVIADNGTDIVELFFRFLHNLLLSLIVCLDLLSLINLKINNFNIRILKPFYPVFSNINYNLNSPENLLKVAGDMYSFDFI
jgi:hypothetical protein